MNSPLNSPEWFSRNVARERTTETVRVDGCDIVVTRWGPPTASALIFVHGGGAHRLWWSPIAPFFVDDGWQVLAIDLSGHGDSGRRDDYRVEQWADEVLAVIDAQVAGGRSVVIGHSLGSHVAVVAAARQPTKMIGTVLVDFGLREPGDSRSTTRRFRHQITYRTRDEALERFRLIPRQDCANEYFLHYLAEHSVAPAENDRWRWKFDVGVFGRSIDRYIGDYLAEMKGPVAFIPGERSRAVPPIVVERALRMLGRQAPTVVVPDAAHHVWIDQPLAFVAALRGVLEGWSPRKAKAVDSG